VRSIDVHFHDGRARAGADAEKRGENVARFLGHTDDGKTARRHYLNRGVTMLRPNAKIKATLADGSLVRTKVVVSEVWKILSEFNAEGDPIYVVKAQVVTGTIAPEHLRKPL
jgi:hypothetical protein